MPDQRPRAGNHSVTRRPAFAKINLALAVGPPEPPRGYHPIASWFACTGLHDDVLVEPLSPGAPGRHTIEWAPDAPRPSPIDWPVEKDLGARAHRSLEAHIGRTLPIRLTIRKRIPVGGGLGGGSADAAAVLIAINDAFGLALAPAALRDIGMTLGSDVGFFLDEQPGASGAARPALVEGFGERLARFGPVAGVVTLFFPPFGCPTGAVYAAFDAAPRPLDSARVRGLTQRHAAAGGIDPSTLFNDLAGPAERVEPRLGEYRARLGELVGRPVHVTGSGSTMFALADNEAHGGAMARAALARPDLLPSLAAVAVPLI